jgi:hypothetical protein
MRRKYISSINLDPLEKPSTTNSDIVYFQKNGSWQIVPNKSGDFFTKRVIAGPKYTFILTNQNELLKLNENEITKIEGLGEIETAAITKSGNVLVSVKNDAIYEYDEKWIKKYSLPPNVSISAHWTYIAEDNGRIAYAVVLQGRGERVRLLKRQNSGSLKVKN